MQSYPLANPNGIVIDVPNLQHPGTATKLTSDDPRIRFVKIMNRDQGVRFIVYVHGTLPRYRIEPAGRGIVALLSDWFPKTTGEIVHVDGGLHAIGA